MAWALSWEDLNPATLTNASGTTQTLTRSVTAGEVVFAAAVSGGAGSVTGATFTDSQGNTWTAAKTTTNGFYSVSSAWAVMASTGSITITATYNVATTFKGIKALGLSGLNSSPLDGTPNGSQQTVGSGTDNLVSGTITTTGTGVLVGFTWDLGNNITPTAGTGFTSTRVDWVAQFGGARLEYKSVTAGSNQATFSSPGPSDAWVVHGAAFKEPTGGSFTGTGSAAASPFAASGSGTETFTGTGSSALKSFAASGSGAETFTGSGSAAAQPFGASGTGVVTAVLGTAAAAMSPFAVSGSGAETFTGTGSTALKSFGASGGGAETFSGSGSAATQPFGASATGLVTSVIGTGAAATQPFGASGTGAETFSGSGSAALKSFGASGSGTVTFNFTGTGSAALKSFGASGAGFTGPAEPPLTPPFTTVVDPVTLSTWVDSVVLTASVDPVRLSLGERLKTRMTTDTYPITNTLVNNGVPVNLAGYTVTINIVSQDRATVKRANGACTVTDAANGRVSYTPSSGDVDTAGSYVVQWKAISGTGVPYHFPQDGYEPLEIQPSLG